MLIAKTKFRNVQKLLPIAMMYNEKYLSPQLDNQEVVNKVNSILSYAKLVYCNNNGKIINGYLVKYILEKSPSYVKGNIVIHI